MVTKWLITGGCGFIGRNLIRSLLEDGNHAIRVIDNLSVGSKEDLNRVCKYIESSPETVSVSHLPAQGVELVVGDILDERLAMDVAGNMDIIVHLAANTGVAPSVENPRMDCVTNVLGTLNYLEAARQKNVSRFIFASSGAPAGECEPPIHEELPPHPVSPYGASKLAGEGYCSAYAKTYGIDTVALRFSNVYGQLSTKKDSVVAKFIKLALEDRPLEIFGDGTQTRDFIHIDDLIRAVRLAGSVEGIGGETFQIATAHETSIDEIVQLLTRLFKQLPDKRNITVRYSASRQGDVKRNFSDTSKAASMLGWRPEISLYDGLERTIKWFIKTQEQL